jgi:F-type H+-transporting ATPase subunit delta
LASTIIAERYAHALIEMMANLAEIDRASNDLTSVIKIIESDDKFRKFFLSPRIMPASKKELVGKVLAGRVSKSVTNLIFIMIDKHRENIIFDVFEQFKHLANEIRGVETGTVITAVPMDDRDFKLLEEKVQRFSGRRVTLSSQVDPSIIGGVVLWLGNHVIDGSIRHRLDTIRRNLMELKPQLQQE